MTLSYSMVTWTSSHLWKKGGPMGEVPTSQNINLKITLKNFTEEEEPMMGTRLMRQ